MFIRTVNQKYNFTTKPFQLTLNNSYAAGGHVLILRYIIATKNMYLVILTPILFPYFSIT